MAPGRARRLSERYALFVTPDHDTKLSEFGRTWLGRDHVSGEALAQPFVDGFSAERMAEVTASPRRYGFHGTLKPPFELAGGVTATALDRIVSEFAANQETLEIGPLIVASIGGFLALVPAHRSSELTQFAADCVRNFDRFRKPADDAEIAVRKSRGLTASQEENLAHWGYPYVIDDFRFHLTLSERLGGNDQGLLLRTLKDRASDFSLSIDALSIFHQLSRAEPFVEIARYSLREAP